MADYQEDTAMVQVNEDAFLNQGNSGEGEKRCECNIFLQYKKKCIG